MVLFKLNKLTLIIKSEAHIHQCLGWSKIIRVGALEQNNCKVLSQTIERRFRHSFVLRSLSIDKPGEPQPPGLLLKIDKYF
jgi:hypothetical protein